MQEIALLGGSNSVLKYGIKCGLASNSKLYNYSLGASSSLQNLHELIKNSDRINSVDCVVTESNVNDFHCVWLAEFPIGMMLKNIDQYYLMLASIKTKVLIILLPLVSMCDISIQINSRHILNIKRYGFSYINLDHLIKSNELLGFYVRDTGHPNKYLMNIIGMMIAHNLEKFPERILPTIKKSNIEYKVVGARDFLLNIKTKKNSAFSRDCITLDSIIKFKECYYGYNILGIEAWSDGYSKIKINDNYLKAYNDELQFHDLSSLKKIDKNTQLSSDLSEQLPTEFGLNAYLINSLHVPDSKPKKQVKPVRLSSVLLSKRVGEEELIKDNPDNSFDCSFLVPDLKLLYLFHIESREKKGRWKRKIKNYIRTKYIKMMKS